MGIKGMGLLWLSQSFYPSAASPCTHALHKPLHMTPPCILQSLHHIMNHGVVLLCYSLHTATTCKHMITPKRQMSQCTGMSWRINIRTGHEPLIVIPCVAWMHTFTLSAFMPIDISCLLVGDMAMAISRH